jgi:transposase
VSAVPPHCRTVLRILSIVDFHKELAKAVKQLEAARVNRDALIYEASRSGISERQIAEATGLSPGRVHQLIKAWDQTQAGGKPRTIFKEKPPSPKPQRGTDRNTRLKRVRERTKTEADQQKRDHKP